MTSFDPETPWEIRAQILAYQATSHMADTERAAYLGLPKGCRIRENAKILSPKNLTIGEHCWIGEGAVLDASGGLTIGSHTSIGLSVFIWTHDSHQLNVRGANTRDQQHRIRRKPTSIGSNCFIAGPSVVLPGVTIGDKCIVAPMSVVAEDLPPRTIFNPQAIDSARDDKLAALQARIEALEERLKQMAQATGAP